MTKRKQGQRVFYRFRDSARGNRIDEGYDTIAYVGTKYMKLTKFPWCQIHICDKPREGISKQRSLDIYADEREFLQTIDKKRIISLIKKYNYDKRSLEDIKFIREYIQQG